ncbi:MAG: helical backbone metal receptor [Ginsengibacter sp.]
MVLSFLIMILTRENIGSKKYNRIVSLVPSQTELLFDLGLEKEVVGITKFCIHPDKWFREKARVGGTKKINSEKIKEISPDLIIANKEENVKEQIENLVEEFDVWITDVNTLKEATEMIRDIGSLCDREREAKLLASEIKAGFKNLNEDFSNKEKKKAAYFIWKDPWMVAGGDTFINEMMNQAGFENVFATLDRYPEINLEDIPLNTEFILLSSEPYPFKEKHKTEFAAINPQLKVELVDGEMFSWYGSRLLKSIDYFHSFWEKR